MRNFIVFIFCPIVFIALCLAAEKHNSPISIIGGGIYFRKHLNNNFWN